MLLQRVIAVVAAGLAALLVPLLGGGGAWEDAAAASRVCEAVQAWQAKGLHATTMWLVREVLARQWWLGPLRPDPPLDPLAACGMPPGESPGCSWWSLLLQPSETRQLLACLEEAVTEAEGEHDAFSARLWRGAVLGLALTTLGLVATCCLARRVAQATRGRQGATGTAGNACDDISASALMEQWATPAAGLDEDDEAIWATPPDGACKDTTDDEEYYDARPLPKKRRRRRKEASPAVENPESAEEAGVKDGKNPAVKVKVDGKAENEAQHTVPKKAKEKKRKVADDPAPKAEIGDTAVVEKVAPKPEEQKVPKKAKEEQRKVVAVVRACKTTKKPAPAQHRAAVPGRNTGVRESWQEDVVTVQLPVAPPMRQHVIGPRGDTVRQLREKYPSVHVAVPPLEDKTSAYISIRGLKSQAAAVAQDIAGRLADIETQLREAQRRRQESRATAVLDVAPNMRRFVVGPGGEELLRLSQQHPGVRVSVPPPSDTESRSVTIRGPPAEVAAVQASIKERLEALERKRQLLRERNRRRRRQAAEKRRG